MTVAIAVSSTLSALLLAIALALPAINPIGVPGLAEPASSAASTR